MVRNSQETEVLQNCKEKGVIKGNIQTWNIESILWTLTEMAKFSGYSNFLLTGSHTSSSFPISP